jgi:hypothetical protein
MARQEVHQKNAFHVPQQLLAMIIKTEHVCSIFFFLSESGHDAFLETVPYSL